MLSSAFAEKQAFVAQTLDPRAPTPPREMTLADVFASADYNGSVLVEAHRRICRLSDLVCGPVPRGVATDETKRAKMEGLVGGLSEHIRQEAVTLGMIHNELNRIASALGMPEDAVGVGTGPAGA